MMEHRWKLVFWIGAFLLVLAEIIRLVRFYRNWYGMPVTLNKILSASLHYVKGDWPSLLFGVLLLAGMAANWAIAKKRATQLK